MADLTLPDRTDDDRAPASIDGGARDASILPDRASVIEPPRRSALAPLFALADAAVDIVEPLLGRGPAGPRWVLVEQGGDFAVHQVRKNRAESVAPSTVGLDARSKIVRDMARSKNVELRLDPDAIITRQLALPADGRSFLDAIIGHRLDRLTPWKPENVLYGYRLVAERPAENLIDVEFAGTSREVVRDRLVRLDGLGITPTAIGNAAEPIEQPISVDLLRGLGDRRRLARRRTLRIALLAAAPTTIALFCASFLALGAQEQRLDTAETALATQRSTLLAGTGGDPMQQAARALIEEKQPEAAKFLLIDRLAEAIPSDTFLTDMEIAPETLRLRGSSANAPALIPILEAVPGLQGVRFEAPVAREADGRDRFDIVAILETGAEAAGTQ